MISSPVRHQEPAIPVPNHSSLPPVSSPHAATGINSTLPHGTSVNVATPTAAPGTPQAHFTATAATSSPAHPSVHHSTHSAHAPGLSDPGWADRQRELEERVLQERWGGYPMAPHAPKHLMRGEDRVVYDPLAREEFLADVDAQRLRTLRESMSTIKTIMFAPGGPWFKVPRIEMDMPPPPPVVYSRALAPTARGEADTEMIPVLANEASKTIQEYIRNAHRYLDLVEYACRRADGTKWELVSDDHVVRVEKALLKDSSLPCYKGEVLVRAPPHAVFEYLTGEPHDNWESAIVYELINRYADQNGLVNVKAYRQGFDHGTLSFNRDMCLFMCGTPRHDGSFVIMVRSLLADDSFPEQSGYVRAEVKWGGFLVAPSQAERGASLVRVIMQIDGSGWLPHALSGSLMAEDYVTRLAEVKVRMEAYRNAKDTQKRGLRGMAPAREPNPLYPHPSDQDYIAVHGGHGSALDHGPHGHDDHHFAQVYGNGHGGYMNGGDMHDSYMRGGNISVGNHGLPSYEHSLGVGHGMDHGPGFSQGYGGNSAGAFHGGNHGYGYQGHALGDMRASSPAGYGMHAGPSGPAMYRPHSSPSGYAPAPYH